MMKSYTAFRIRIQTPLIFLAVLLVAGCSYQGGDVNPLERKLTWFSYLNGDDLRSRCEPGQGDTMRLVYNAIHTEQLRSYDVSVPAGLTQGSVMQARVLGPASLLDVGFSDLIAPWRGKKATTRLRTEDVEKLWSAMENSGAFDPAPVGLHLKSEKFFWLTAICRNGKFYYNAYAWPSDRFDAIRFNALVFAWDMTDIPVNPPRQATMFDIYGDASPKKKTGAYYQITIGENGLKNVGSLFGR